VGTSTINVSLKNAAATAQFGKWLATKVAGGDVVSLQGPLGAGKTTLLQGLAAGLGLKKRSTSPTFILFRVIALPRTRHGIRTLIHADAYRAKNADEFISAGFKEFLGDASTLTVIEWGDRVRTLLPRSTITIRLKGETGRIVTYPARLGRVPRDVAA
jgi:tRNA threonylcarbamoyladenosine biosynthesis protein TsaE